MINLPKKRACNLNYFFKLILVVLLLALPIVNASDVVVQSGNLNISNNIYYKECKHDQKESSNRVHKSISC